MSGPFAPVNAPGGYFAAQEATAAGLDPFAVLGLHVDDGRITMRGVQTHFRHAVMRHVFERGLGQVATRGFRVPTWAQVNSARELLLGGTPARFLAQRALGLGLVISSVT
jgi:hypothetical protein